MTDRLEALRTEALKASYEIPIPPPEVIAAGARALVDELNRRHPDLEFLVVEDGRPIPPGAIVRRGASPHMTATEVAESARVSEETVLRAISERRLRASRAEGRLQIDPEDARRWVENRGLRPPRVRERPRSED